MTQETLHIANVLVDCLIKGVEQGLDLVPVVSDSTSTAKIAPFIDKFPERLINVGIAEQTLVGVAAGLALGGKIPVTCNAAPFLISRANEQIKNDICYSNVNAKLVGLNAGVSYAALASTHHSIDDISVMRGFGNIQIFAPCDGLEAKQIFEYAFAYDGPVYIRSDGANLKTIHPKSYQFIPGKVDVLREGKDITIFALGTIAQEAFAAAEALEESGISVEVINVSSIRPLDEIGILNSIQKNKCVLTVEEHNLSGGLSTIVSTIIAEAGIGIPFRRLGFKDGEYSKAGPRDAIRNHHGINHQGIKNTVISMLNN